MNTWKDITIKPEEGKILIAAWFSGDELMMVSEAQVVKGKWYSLEDSVPRAVHTLPTHWMTYSEYYQILQGIEKVTE